MNQSTNPRATRRGFTLTEILVVIGIIVILLAIAIPMVGKVRTSARVAGVQAQLNGLQGAITRYQQDHGALPGPLSNDHVRNVSTSATLFATRSPAPTGFAMTVDPKKITAAENLVLGLCGGLVLQTTTEVAYDPSLVGNGPNNLNAGNVKKSPAYIEATNLSWREEGGLKTGDYKDNAGDADDTIIPEFVDTFTSPMPILYLRAKKGAPPVAVATANDKNNSIITNVPDTSSGTRGHYDVNQYVGYTMADTGGNYIGEGKIIDPGDYKPNPPVKNGQLPHGLGDANVVNPPAVDLNASMIKAAQAPLVYRYPYNAYPYFKNPTSPTTDPQPRQKDGYILISAGVDRVYGTPDDITSFGSVNE
jgi:prepilin-type N-terminal cleavage/methylation domain-containing protein